MRKIILTAMVFAFVANASAQLKVDASGNTRIFQNIYLESTSGIFGITGNVPITFKVSGFLAGYTGSSGKSNVSFGYGSLYSSTTGSSNTANGHSALYFNTSGSYNTASGTDALYANTSGSYNTANGYGALRYNTSSYNTAIGYGALSYNETGYSNTAVGSAADVTTYNLYNVTAIGNSAKATSNSQVRIGNSSVTSIGGYASWSNVSDKRMKKNIRADVPGLAFINLLQPVTYNLDLDAIDGLLKINKTKREGEEELPQELIDIEKKAREAKEIQVQTGFIAQDVEVTAQSIGYDFSGVDVDEAGVYGLRYAEFVVPLVKAVQELSEQNDRLQAQVTELAELVYTLQGKDAAAENRNANKLSTGVQDVAGSGASLQQNSPNPFSQDTQIKFYLPQNIRTASLNIYDLQGKQLKQLVLNQRGESSQLISGSEFAVGIYLYALIADGREVDVKRMILTE